MQVVYKNGIHVPELSLWLDPGHVCASAFVSHAHADHMRHHHAVYATPATAAMMRQRGAHRSVFHETGFGVPVPWHGAQVTLFPAGHVLGSAQMLVEHQGTRMLYSGDFKLRPGLSAEVAQVPRADILVMETTFGRPRYRFPPAAEVMAAVREWCADSLHEGFLPVLFCYSLGKGQEVLAGLQGGEFRIGLHLPHWQISEIYGAHEVDFPSYELYDEELPFHGVLVCAGQCRNSRWFRKLPRVRTAYLSGWALDGGHQRFKTDAAFALSDHADYEDLLVYVRRSGARTVYTVHGFVDEFAADLRSLGLDARPLNDPRPLAPPPVQLGLF